MNPQTKLEAFGTAKEDELKPVIEKVLNLKLKKTKQKFDTYDFYNRKAKVLVELKSRQFSSDKFYKTIIGRNKLKYLNDDIYKDYTLYMFFNFTDGTYYIKYDPAIEYNKNYKNIFIPTADLTKVEA